MATRNAFDLLTDFTSDDPSLLSCNRLRSADPPKADRPTPAPRFLPLKKCREIEDQESNCFLESGFRKKPEASDNLRIDKEVIEVIGGDIRGVVNKGVKRSLLDDPDCKKMFGRKREVVGDISKNFVRASAKNRHYNFCGFTGRSSLARKMSERKRGGITKSNRSKDRWWVEDEYLDVSESDRFAYEDLDDFLSDDAFEEQVIRSLIEEHESSDDKMMTLEQYGKVMEEKKQILQATLTEISAKRQEEEDFINEFVIIEAEDDELEADELDDFLLV